MVSRQDVWWKYLQEKSEQTADILDAITLENMKARVMKELQDPKADNNDNVHKRIVDILIAPSNEWKKGEKIISSCDRII